MYNKRISIFTGHFGSGKTEIAINYALELKKRKDRVCLLDMDIINPYFRSGDAAESLKRYGIRIITPVYANTNVDVPALGGEFNMIFTDKESAGVMDIGGDDLGAAVVARYRDDILSNDHILYFVINTRRPMTDTPDKIIACFNEIADCTGIRPCRLVNNTNVLEHTTGEVIAEGRQIILEAAQKLNCPIEFTAIMGDLPAPPAIIGSKYNSEKVLRLSKNIFLPF